MSTCTPEINSLIHRHPRARLFSHTSSIRSAHFPAPPTDFSVCTETDAAASGRPAPMPKFSVCSSCEGRTPVSDLCLGHSILLLGWHPSWPRFPRSKDLCSGVLNYEAGATCAPLCTSSLCRAFESSPVPTTQTPISSSLPSGARHSALGFLASHCPPLCLGAPLGLLRQDT